MRRIVVCLVILAVLASSFFYTPLKAQGDCYVPSEYGTIQAAEDDAGCTTIHVAAGDYNEPLINIDRNLTLRGAGVSSTTLTGRIDVHDTGPVNISGLTISNQVSDTCAIFYDHSSGNATDNAINSFDYGVCYENGSGNVERNYINSNVGVVYYPDMDSPTISSGNVRNNNIYGDFAGVAYAIGTGTVEGNAIDAMVGVAVFGSDVVVRNNPDIYSLAGVLYILSKGSIEGNTIDASIGVASALSCTLGSIDVMGPDYSFGCTGGLVNTLDNVIESDVGITYIASVGSIDGNTVEGDALGIASALSGIVTSFSYNEGTGAMNITFSSGEVSITENQVTGDGGLAGILDIYGLGTIQDNFVTGYTGSSSPLGSMGFGILTAVVPEFGNFSPLQLTDETPLTSSGQRGFVRSDMEDLLPKILEALQMGEFPIPALLQPENLSLTGIDRVALTQVLQQDESALIIEANTVVGNETGIEVIGFPAPIELPFEEFPITITRNLTSENELHGIEAYFAMLGSPLNSLSEARNGGDAHAALAATVLQQGEGFPLIITDNVATLNGLDDISYTWPFEGYIINNTSSFNTEDGIDLACLEDCFVMNNISTSNGSAPGDGGIEVDAEPPIGDYNDVWGNFENYIGLAPGPNDISQDPLFASPTGDLHLSCTSPALNVGNNSAPDIPAIDFDAESRIQGGIVDLGAFEGCAEPVLRRATALPSMLPAAVNHISEGSNLLKQAEDLLTQAKESGKDTAQCEKMVEEARKLLEEAGRTLKVPIIANNKALAGITKLKQAIECLKALLG